MHDTRAQRITQSSELTRIQQTSLSNFESLSSTRSVVVIRSFLSSTRDGDRMATFSWRCDIRERYIHCSLVFKSINLLCNSLFRNSWPVCDFYAPVAKLQKWYCAALRHTVSVFQLGYLQECECRCLVPKGWLSRMLGLHCVAWWNSSYSRDTLRAVIIQRVWRRVGSKILTPYWCHPVLFKFQS